eukprot:1108437-Prymnesium_polylepis.1
MCRANGSNPGCVLTSQSIPIASTIRADPAGATSRVLVSDLRVGILAPRALARQGAGSARGL